MSSHGLSLGIDLGGTKILAAVMDAQGQILHRAKQKTKAEQGPAVVIARMIRTCGQVLEEAGLECSQVRAIGVGAPGPLDPGRGLVLEAPNLPGWKDVPLAHEISQALGGAPALLCNDVNAGAWGEFKMGAGRGSSHCLGVFIGTGIGAGIILSGQLYEGASRVAGEIGHMCLRPKGPRCGCGRRGCLETLCSRTAITREIWKSVAAGKKTVLKDWGEIPGSLIGSSMLKKAFDEGDKVVVKAVREATSTLGRALGSAANLINPDCIVLGGGLVEAFGQTYLELIEPDFKKQAFKDACRVVKLVEASLGDDAGVLGAALLAREHFSK